jgi:hypothetical protein
MKQILLGIFLLAATAAGAQKQAVLDALKEHQVDPKILDPEIKKHPTDLAYDLKYSSISNEKEKITLAHYDPTKPEAERWTVLSVDGRDPSSSEIKKFKKEHAQQPPAPSKIDESTMKIEQESAEQLVISYKLDPATIPSEASFLKDCRNYLTIDLRSKRLTSLQSRNEKPVKIKILNASKLEVTIDYTYSEQLQRYLPQKEDLVMIIRLLGQEAPMETVSVFSNFTK